MAGVDIGGTKIEVVITDRSFQPVATRRRPTPRGGPAAVIDAVVELISEATHDAGHAGVAAAGVGAPGTVDREHGIVARSPNLPGWSDPVSVGPELARRLGAPVVVDNDVRSAVVGEYRLGNARAFRDVLGVWFGTGIGGALILDGTLRRGRIGACGEIGHMVAKRGGRLCGCGRHGCLEAYAGRGAMERRVRRLVAQGRRTDLLGIMERSGRTHITSGVIAKALTAGDRIAADLIDDAVGAAGPVIASAVNLLDVEAVVIGGGVASRLGASFTQRVAMAMEPHLVVQGSDRVQVLTASLGDAAGALGAAVQAAEIASSGSVS